MLQRPLHTAFRAGRLQTRCEVRVLPRVFVDTGGNLAASAADEMWRLPNTFGEIRLDTRLNRQTNGNEDPTVANPTASSFANQFPFMVGIYSQRFSSAFGEAGKSVLYALGLVGVDAFGSDKRITLTSSGDLDLPFRTLSPPATKAWFEQMFPLAASGLAQQGMPLPSVFTTDFESSGDIGGSAYGAGPGQGFLGQAFQTDLTKQLTASKTLGQWLAANPVTQSGQVWNPGDPSSSPSPYNWSVGSFSNPVNNDRALLAMEINGANYSWRLDQAVFQPYRTSFGSSAACGEWDIWCASLEFQAPVTPIGRVFRSTERAVTRQVVINYCNPTNYTLFSADEAQPPAPGWNRLPEWLAFFPQVGPPPPALPNNAAFTPEYLVCEQVQRASLEARTLQAKAAAYSVPDKPLLPYVAVANVSGITLTQRREVIPYLVRYMLNTVALGATEFIFFATSWNDSADERTVNTELVKVYNSAHYARQPLRNRVFRCGA